MLKALASAWVENRRDRNPAYGADLDIGKGNEEEEILYYPVKMLRMSGSSCRANTE